MAVLAGAQLLQESAAPVGLGLVAAASLAGVGRVRMLVPAVSGLKLGCDLCFCPHSVSTVCDISHNPEEVLL